MEQMADRLAEKLHTLSSAQLVEVERLVESLQAWEHDRQVTRAMAHASEPSFSAIWDNPEDAIYDEL